MRTVYRLRGWLMVPPVVFITLCTARETESKLLVLGVGCLVFALGVVLRVWSQMHLHYRLKIKKVLTVTGPYAFVRNPMYIGNALLLVGVCMLTELFWFVPIQVLYCAVVYSFVVHYEETRLAEKYGKAYIEYSSLVPRWFPKFGLSRLPTGGARFREFFGPSVWAEVHTLLLLIPFIIKELAVA